MVVDLGHSSNFFTGDLLVPGWLILAVLAVGVVLVVLTFVRSEPIENPFTLLALGGIFLVILAYGSAVVREVATANRISVERTLYERTAALDARAAALDTAQAEAGISCVVAVSEAMRLPCEIALFETPQMVAAAKSLLRTRLALVAEATDLAHLQNTPQLMERVALWRRPLESDPYGLAASMLMETFGCSADNCPQLAVLGDATQLVANMKDNRFQTVAAKYARIWERNARNRGTLVDGMSITGPFGLAVGRSGDKDEGDGAPGGIVNLPVEGAEPLPPRRRLAP